MRTNQEHTVDFLGNQIACVQADDGTVYVPLKRLCEILGIDHNWQRVRIKNSEVFTGLVMPVPGTDGNHYRMFCLPLDELYGWLYTVNPNTVRPEIIEKLIDYQEESRRALRNYETHSAAVNPRMMAMSAEELETLVTDAVKRAVEKFRRDRMLQREIALIEDVAADVPGVKAKAQTYIEVAKARYNAWLADFETNTSDDTIH